jgi:hypothetical protein
MKIKYKLNNYFQIDNKCWFQYLIKHEGFKAVKKSTVKLTNSSSYFSSHPNSIKIQIDFTNYPEIEVEAKNWVFSKSFLETIVQNWIKNREERVFIYSQNQVSSPSPKLSYLPEKSMGGVAELFSRLLLPSLAVMICAFAFYVLMCFYMIKTIVSEMKYDVQNPQTYLSFNQIQPSELSLYTSNIDFMYAAILLALLGGGFFFGVQQLLICIIVKFWSGILKNKIALIIVLGAFQGMIYFLPLLSSIWLIFIPYSFLSYFVFSFLTRKIPFYNFKRSV